MSTKNLDYSERNKYALAHMIGQLADIGVDTSLRDVSIWFGISKYKAQKLINMLVDEGVVYEIRTSWRSNASRKEYGQTLRGRAKYELNIFKSAYKYFSYEKIFAKQYGENLNKDKA